jgi:hypothetical protein
MLFNPAKGQRVRLHYRESARRWFPLHGKIGTVKIVGKGKPRNHGVEVEGVMYVVPSGNLQKLA